ncbi:hypothetical protein ABHI18_012642, partial [Aspergillus niger]
RALAVRDRFFLFDGEYQYPRCALAWFRVSITASTSPGCGGLPASSFVR